jgi:hypothetical protein
VAAPTLIPLDGELAGRLLEVPTAAGAGQILGEEGRSLVIGRPASLRRWAASHLGAGRPPRPGKRPPTDLRPVARALSFTATTSGFHQRLVFERMMARYVPASARRDLTPPAWLHLDPAERFPRVTVRGVVAADASLAGLFGPFRNRRAAARAVAALHKVFPLRPCDFEFDPAPDLALGLGCVYAQVRTCAAPCLSRVSEDGYRGLAAEASQFLARPRARPEEAGVWIPEWVASAQARALILEKGRDGIEIYPVMAGQVLEQHVVTVRGEDIEDALEGLRWTGADETGHDRDWLAAWLYTPRRAGRYVVLEGDENLAALVRHAITSAA